MAWVRVGDEALSHPKLMSLYDVEGAEDISIIEMFGFLMALATYSAKHLTDGIIERGAAFRDGDRSRSAHLIDVAVGAGLLTWVEVEGKRKLRLFTDEEFIHVQPREEVMRRRARSRENRDPNKKAAVIFRDGDQCRYCGKVVRWTGPKGYNLGTLDHVDPDSLGDAPVEGLVVACYECNSSRGHAREAFDAASPLRPVPTTPYYGVWSAEFLTRYGYEAAPSVDPGTPVDPASETPARGVLPGRGSGAPVDPGRGSSGPAEGAVRDPGASERRASEGPRIRRSPDSSPNQSPTSKGIKANTLGSGRDGTGRAGQGRAGTGQAGKGQGRAGTGQAGKGQAEHPRTHQQQTNKRNRRRKRR